MGLTQMGLTQMGLTQMGLTQMWLTQMELTQMGLTQMGLTQMRLTQMGLTHGVNPNIRRAVGASRRPPACLVAQVKWACATRRCCSRFHPGNMGACAARS